MFLEIVLLSLGIVTIVYCLVNQSLSCPPPQDGAKLLAQIGADIVPDKDSHDLRQTVVVQATAFLKCQRHRIATAQTVALIKSHDRASSAKIRSEGRLAWKNVVAVANSEFGERVVALACIQEGYL